MKPLKIKSGASDDITNDKTPPVVETAMKFIRHYNEITREFESGISSEYAIAQPKKTSFQERQCYRLAIGVLGKYFKDEIKRHE